MINSVRNTVMFLLNKDNRGYLSPSEYNYFAKTAQLEIFESYFMEHARAVAMQNKRKKSLNYGDTVDHIENKIDKFYKQDTLTYNDVANPSPGQQQDFFDLPTDLYKLINITYGGGFGTSTITGGGKVISPVSPRSFDMIVNSNYTAPSVTNPIYVRKGDSVYVRPLSIVDAVNANYYRKPVDPNWSYNTINGDPVYNATNSTDFEVSAEDEVDLIIKICKYAGLSIREAEVVAVAEKQEQVEFTKENI